MSLDMIETVRNRMAGPWESHRIGVHAIGDAARAFEVELTDDRDGDGMSRTPSRPMTGTCRMGAEAGSSVVDTWYLATGGVVYAMWTIAALAARAVGHRRGNFGRLTNTSRAMAA